MERERWTNFLDEFTRENRGAHARLEVLGRELGHFVEVEDRPFDGIAADAKDGEDAVWIYFGSAPDDRLAHGIEKVTSIRVRTPTNGGPTLEIQSADGVRTLVQLTPPDEFALPPVR